ncbi:neutral zinc metallopeptidase [Blastococcus sp. PRF04-17]|uniref:neutral zinc metallopeptidase n=1 Tax=Blastococcus sp. PRF04-17 TaxID=2933797 RepID=UPI001FF67CBA|nr:neutral zinc metallopeptidase [Blastococcus sp. PRF04-17]UOY01431.1 neutral zinc metallopeptidase [Blastococcus sp. PRF04-17]
MRQVLRRAVPAAVVLTLLTGCSAEMVTGQASPGPGEPVDVAPESFPITGVSDSDIDRLARNALADLDTFWSEAYPEFYGEEYTPLENGFFSVDSEAIDTGAYPETGIGCEGSPTSPDSVAGNAFYDPSCDLIAYDRALLDELSTQYGRFLVPVVMAHEFGHAMQGRFGFAESGRGIQDETQADCLAGAWTAWVAAGEAEHVSLREPELDDVIRGFLLLRDDVGSDPDDTQAHGSYFDRVSAFYEGFDGGVAPCRDDFGEDRLFTAAAFTSDEEYQSGGNAEFDLIVQWIAATLPEFWSEVFPAAYGEEFTPPAIDSFQGTPPDCEGLEDRDLGYCAAEETVYLDDTDLATPAYSDIGDFALATAIALPYSLAVRDQAGLSIDDGAATMSAVCLTGWYEAQWYNGAFADSIDAVISPGDIDEAVQFLLEYGVRDEVFPNVDASGFELVGAFRTGFLEGGAACELER